MQGRYLPFGWSKWVNAKRGPKGLFLNVFIVVIPVSHPVKMLGNSSVVLELRHWRRQDTESIDRHFWGRIDLGTLAFRFCMLGPHSPILACFTIITKKFGLFISISYMLSFLIFKM